MLAPPDVTPSVLAQAHFGASGPGWNSEAGREELEAMKSALEPAEGVNVRAIEGCLGALLICAGIWLAVGVIVWGWL